MLMGIGLVAIVRYMSQEALQYLQIHRMSNPQLICGIVKRYLQLFKGISAVRIVKGICGIT